MQIEIDISYTGSNVCDNVRSKQNLVERGLHLKVDFFINHSYKMHIAV